MTLEHPDLAAWVAQGDSPRAARWLVEALADDVYGLCRAMVWDTETAEDLAQDTFIRALSGLATYRGEASPRTWLLTIARNRCIDHLRRQRRSPLDSDDEPEVHADPSPSEVERLLSRADVFQGLAVLPELDRALVVLHHGHGLRYAELAQAFGIKEGTARMRVSRALARMREALEAPPPFAGVVSDSRSSEARPQARPMSRSSRRRMPAPGAPPPQAVDEAAELDERAMPAPASAPPPPAGAPQAAPPAPSKKRSAGLSGLVTGLFRRPAQAEQTEAPAASAPPEGSTTPALHSSAPGSLRGRLDALLAAL